MKLKDLIRYSLPTAWHLFRIAIYPTALNRQMLRGKMRRFWLVYFRRRYVEEVLLPRRRSTCQRTGACCQYGFGCPAFDTENSLCKIHPHKPLSCKLYPLTQEDLDERDLVMPQKACGYSFVATYSSAPTGTSSTEESSDGSDDLNVLS